MALQSKLLSGRSIGRLIRWLIDERGNVGPILALMVVPIIGAFAISSETASWYMTQRSEQNAADSAVMAAALNGGASYATEAKAVTKAFGYEHTVNNTTITPTTVTCPSVTGLVSGSTCYQVSILRTVPIYLSRVVGYIGDRALGTGRGKDIRAYAIAGTISGTHNFCLITRQDMTINGGSKTELTGCDLLSGTDMTCNGSGSDGGARHGYAVGTNKHDNCGQIPLDGYAGYDGSDPYQSTIATNISNLSCSYGAGGTITSLSGGAGNCFTGGVKLGSDITVSTANTVLVIKSAASGTPNGGLDLNGHKLSTSGAGSLTIVFTGSNELNTQVLANSGTLDYAAPTSGVWKGVAFVEDFNSPNTSGNLDLSYSGSSPTINITGLMDLPNANFTMKGAIDHGSNGYRCIGIVAKTMLISGTGAVFANPTSECRQAGLTLPTVPMVALLH